jgi:AcrR family transcriptional regulator
VSASPTALDGPAGRAASTARAGRTAASGSASPGPASPGPASAGPASPASAAAPESPASSGGKGPSLNRTQYFELGLELLAEGGAKAVTIEALCTRLRVTKGSFYHHFAGVRDFVSQLLAYWEDRYGQRLAREALAACGPAELIPLLKHGASREVHHEAESAIRALAQSDPEAAAVQRRVDQGREDLLIDAYTGAGVPAGSAATLARIGMAILIGTQQRERPVDRDRLFALFEEYQRWVEASLR